MPTPDSCPVCGDAVPGSGPQRRYCSGACRQAAYRKRLAAHVTARPTGAVRPPAAEVSSLAQLYAAASSILDAGDEHRAPVYPQRVCGPIEAVDHHPARAFLATPCVPAVTAGHGTSAVALTVRGREVAALVAIGLSNRQIARHLKVSERTVESHLATVRSRLGLRSRAQVAAWAATHLGEAVLAAGG